jgi:hypothetical protein
MRARFEARLAQLERQISVPLVVEVIRVGDHAALTADEQDKVDRAHTSRGPLIILTGALRPNFADAQM